MVPQPAARWYRVLVLTALAMAIALALVSVHMRLLNSGLGCTDWPECYGRIGGESVTALHEASPAAAPRWATLTHRILASGLGLLILAIFAAALGRGRASAHRPATLMLLAVMVGLAILGRWSAGLQVPGIVMANFTGGILLVGLLWWLHLAAVNRQRFSPAPPVAGLRGWVLAGAILLTVQMLLGGLMSAWFTGLACGPSPTCDGAWVPGLPIAELTRIFQPLRLDTVGRVIGGDALSDLHMLHRLLGLLLVLLLARVAWLARKTEHKGYGLAVLLLIVAETLLGIAAIRFDLAPQLVLGHYALALALLLVLLGMIGPVTDHYRIDRGIKP